MMTLTRLSMNNVSAWGFVQPQIPRWDPVAMAKVADGRVQVDPAQLLEEKELGSREGWVGA